MNPDSKAESDVVEILQDETALESFAPNCSEGTAKEADFRDGKKQI